MSMSASAGPMRGSSLSASNLCWSSAAWGSAGIVTVVGIWRMSVPDMPATAAAREEMATTVTQLEELSAAVPGAFDQAKEDYVADLRADGPALEATFQHELNMGFVNLFWFYGATALLMLVLLLFIPSRQDL